jgi:sugar O-acyltransferase (sialic acid O-acetyltransferase NeuD family)
MTKDRSLYVFGTSGHARELAWIAADAGWRVAAFLAPAQEGGAHPGSTVVLPEDRIADLPEPPFAVIGIGLPARRQAVAHRWDAHVVWATLCHPAATVAPDAELGAGTVLFPQTVVGPGVRIGKHVVLNTGASVSHDGEVGDFALLGPGARMAGHVRVGARAFVGCGAVTRGGTPETPLQIGRDAMVGAGAAVVADVAPGSRVVGVPARPMRKEGLR